MEKILTLRNDTYFVIKITTVNHFFNNRATLKWDT